MSLQKTKNHAASVRQRLLNYARSIGQDFIFILRAFAMERLLFRLSLSPYVYHFVLKGGHRDPNLKLLNICFERLKLCES